MKTTKKGLIRKFAKRTDLASLKNKIIEARKRKSRLPVELTELKDIISNSYRNKNFRRLQREFNQLKNELKLK